MIDFTSKTEDIVWLAYKLVNEMGENVSINKFGLYQEILTGKYELERTILGPRYNGIDFNVKYSSNEFLTINVGEIQSYKSYEEKLKVLNEIYNVIRKINGKNGLSIGEPVAFYNISDGQNKIPHLDWVFCKKEEYVSELVNGTLFDDAVAEDLFLFGSEVEKYVKKKVKRN